MSEKKITNQFHNKPDTSLLAMPSLNGPISIRPIGKLPGTQMPNAQKSLKLMQSLFIKFRYHPSHSHYHIETKHL